MRERVVPRVGAERHALPGGDALHLARLGIGQHHRPRQHVQQLVGAEDRAELRRVREATADRKPEDEAVDALGRGVDQVGDLARLGVAPDVPRHVRAREISAGPSNVGLGEGL